MFSYKKPEEKLKKQILAIMKRCWKELHAIFGIEKVYPLPILKIKSKLKVGTKDQSKYRGEKVFIYCPHKFVEELNFLNVNKNEFKIFLYFAIAESLFMALQLYVGKNIN